MKANVIALFIISALGSTVLADSAVDASQSAQPSEGSTTKLVGCLEQDTITSMYVLRLTKKPDIDLPTSGIQSEGTTVGKITITGFGGIDLQPYTGHEVELSGTLTQATGTVPTPAGAIAKMGLNVSSVKDIAGKCSEAQAQPEHINDPRSEI